MHEDICYKKPFLKEVILRVDFPSVLPGLDKSIPSVIYKRTLRSFPIAEPAKMHSRELQFSGNEFSAKSKEMMRWVFHGREREKTLIIEQNAVIQTTKRYKTYEVFLGDFRNIIAEFYNNYSGLNASRVGLRYVNIIEPNDDDGPLEWAEYINESMLGIIDCHEQKEYITRAFHILEYNFDGHAVKFQFGIVNPDYPAIVTRKQFVLNIDSYFHGSFELNDVMESIEKAHHKIQELFESSITEKTREQMQPVHHG